MCALVLCWFQLFWFTRFVVFFSGLRSTYFKYLQGFIFIVLCSLIIVFRENEILSNSYIPVINVAFLMTASVIGVWWAVASPEDHSVLSLFLMVFGCGLVVIRPWMTVIYFVTIILSFLFIGLAANVVDLKLDFLLDYHCGINHLICILDRYFN
jgi:hypothetical protein